VYGRVTDQSGAVIVDAEVEIKNVETGLATTFKTNHDGLYTVPSLHPGHYLINVRKPGFKSVTVTELTLNVQDNVVRNFALQVGSIAETVTITADDLHINTTDATVSTVVDRQFAENLPMNGRSFQTLIQLTPGVVLTPSTQYDSGQFSVNGQRASANYWMVDGVSANIGIGQNPGNGAGGALASFTAQGGTNSLVSVDAMQEFRIQTSTYAPELNIVGAALNTPLANLSLMPPFLDGNLLVGALGYVLNGIVNSYPETQNLLLGTLTPRGTHFVQWSSNICLVQSVADFGFRHLYFPDNTGYFNVDPATLFGTDPVKSLLAAQNLGTLKPVAPAYISANRYDTFNPYQASQNLASDWCAKGADAQLWTNEEPPFLNKASINTLLPYFVDGERSMQWVADRFNGLPTTPNCGEVLAPQPS